MSALAGGRPHEALASRQENISGRTDTVAEGAELIHDHAMELITSPEARKDAEAATAALGQALQAQGSAKQAMAGNALAQSGPFQQTSAAQLNAAAEALERLGKKMLEEAIEALKDRQPEEEDEQMADAFDAVQEAKRTEDPTAAEKAAKLLEQLYAMALQEAQAMGVMPFQLASMEQMLAAMQSRDSQRGVGLLYTDLTAAELEAMGITLTDWARLPGRLRDEVLQAAGKDSPEEYRQLIKLYFQQIARRGGNGGGEGGEQK